MRRKTDFLILFVCFNFPSQTFDIVDSICKKLCNFSSLSPTPQASITSFVEATSESPNRSDEDHQKLCNSPRNSINSSESVKRDSPTPTTASLITLIDEVKKLEIHTSDPDLNKKSKTNSPLASSSNLAKPDSLNEMRLSCNNSENNSRKSELKWQCLVCC